MPLAIAASFGSHSARAMSVFTRPGAIAFDPDAGRELGGEGAGEMQQTPPSSRCTRRSSVSTESPPIDAMLRTAPPCSLHRRLPRELGPHQWCRPS